MMTMILHDMVTVTLHDMVTVILHDDCGIIELLLIHTTFMTVCCTVKKKKRSLRTQKINTHLLHPDEIHVIYYAYGCYNNNNNILYSSQREIKDVVRSHNEEHISIILSSLNTRTYTLLDIRPLFLSLHTLIANPNFPGIMLSVSNQNVKTLKLNLKNH